MLSLFEKHEGGFRRLLVLLVLVIFLSLNSFARTFYVSSTDGNDSYSITQAQNQSTPWRSLSLVNSIFSSLLPGDNVFFKRGDVFYGNLVANVSGNSAAKITIGAYGTGAKPLFSGFTFAQNWTSLGNGIWQCTLSATNANSNMVVVNDQVQAMGRYPNADAANGGYLNYESFNGYTSFTDNELSASPNWAGADVVMRKTRWIIDICKVGWHSGNSIGYTNPVTVNTYPGKTNFGYFIQNDPRTLDKFGEWYLNRQTKVFQMYFGSLIPTNYTVKVSAVDNIINLSSTRYITVDNIATEGSSMYGIYTKDGNSITIQNCDVRLSSNYGIHVWNSANVIVDNNTVTDVYNNGIYAQNQSSSGTTITNNTLKNIGIHAGMGQSGDKTNIGIFVNGYNTLVQYNNIDGTGYTGLDFAGTNPVIRNNFVTNFCSVKDDGGGIYTQLNKAQTYANTIISGNIVLNAIGAKNGGDLSDQNILTNGIYLDEISGTFEVSNNSVANCGGGGLFYNNIVNVNTTGNTIFNNYKALALQRFTGGGPLLRNNRFTNNVLFPLYDNQYNFHYWNGELYVPTVTDIQSDMRQLGVFDNNYYRNDVVDPFKYFYHTYAGGQFFDPPSSNFDQWKPYMNQDYNSKISATIPKYKINNVVSANKVSAGTFDANISNVNFWSVNNNFSATWDNTNKISGGSIKVTPYSLENQSTLIYSPCGSVTAGKSYILKFSTYGTTVYGNVKASLRQSNAPYATFTSPQSNFSELVFRSMSF